MRWPVSRSSGESVQRMFWSSLPSLYCIRIHLLSKQAIQGYNMLEKPLAYRADIGYYGMYKEGKTLFLENREIGI